MKSRTRVIAMLTLFTTCLLIAIFYGFSVIGRSPQSHLMMVDLARMGPIFPNCCWKRAMSSMG